jgi:phage terminase large subunit-like protein
MADKVVSLEERRRKNREKVARYYQRTQAVKTEFGNRGQCQVCGEEFYSQFKNVKVCGDGGCKKVLARKRLLPFTLKHFESWAGGVVLDTEKPWRLEEFHRLFIADLFAGIPIDWLLVGEGNTKTTTLAGLGLYHCQFKRYGRVPVAAASRDQAFEMYLQAQGMVERSESLQPIFELHEGQRQIKCPSMASRMQVYAADDRTGDGAIFTLALVDELHRHRDLRLYRTWVGKIRKRGGQVAVISTAGEPGSEFEQARENIRQGAEEREDSRKGYLRVRTANVVLHEYALPEDADVEDMQLVKLANPFSGVTIKSLIEKRSDPTTTLDHWKRFTCNIATRGGNPAITEGEWFRQRIDNYGGELREIPRGAPIYAGLDVAWKWDTTALIGLYLETDPLLMLLSRATVLVPPRDGNSLDPDEIEDALIQLHERNPIHTLVMDTTKAEQLAQWAQEQLGCEVIDRAQSNSFQVRDYEKVMEGLRQRTLWHMGDQELSRHALNAVAKMLPGGQVRFDRSRSTRQSPGQERRVIDALTAAGMVVSVAAGEASADYGVIYA